MAGDRGRGAGRRGGGGRGPFGGSTPPRGGSFSPAAFSPTTPNNNSGNRGRGRGRRGGGRVGSSDAAISSCPWTSAAGRGQGSAGGFRDVTQDPRGHPQGGDAGGARGAAAVDPEDRQLLVVSNDPKMQHAWELRIHPSKRFSSGWLAAVDRWVQNMASGSSGQLGVPPPPPPRSRSAAAATTAAAAAAPPPVPDEPVEMDNDDFDFDFSSDDHDGDLERFVEAGGEAAGRGSAGGDNGSQASDDDVYDMVSYLNKVSLADDEERSTDDNVSTAATAGSSIAAARRSRRGSRGGRGQGKSAVGSVGPSSSDRHGRVDDSAAGSSYDGGSSSWETDSEAGEEALLQQLEQQDEAEHEQAIGAAEAAGVADAESQGEVAAAAAPAAAGETYSGASEEGQYEQEEQQMEGDADAMDAALIAAEEADLLGEPQQQQKQRRRQRRQRQHTDSIGTRGSSSSTDSGQASCSMQSAAGAGGAAAVGEELEEEEEPDVDTAAAGRGSDKQPKQRRGERKRERWQQHCLVSLRLEKQGLTDKEAQLLSTWYHGSAAAQRLSMSKLWLFDNALGDAAAAALAQLIGPSTTEIHLSHNQLGVAGAKALLAAVPLQRSKGLKPLWLRLEWNQIDATELRRFIEQDCAARGLVVDIAKELPVSERKCSDSRGRELNLAWSLPWTGVHVQMPWLSCQRSKPEEAAVLQAAKAVWGRRAAAAAAGPGRLLAASAQRSQWQRSAGDGGVTPGGSSRVGGVVAAMAAAAGGGEDMQLPLLHPPPPPPPPAKLAAATSNSSSTAFAAPLLPAQAGSSSSTNSSAVEYQDGPLMLFVDTSAFLAMLGCPGSVTSSTNLTLKLLQALAGSGRFGRGLSPEQQSFIVLADTVLKQLDSFKAAEGGVGGPVRRFLDKGLDEVGPKGLDFLTVLAAHEGEGLVVDRGAAVAGSRSPAFSGTTGQRSDLAIIEVALFFRTELLAAAAAAVAASQNSSSMDEGGVTAEPSTPTRDQQAAAAAVAAEAQPVILVTNDNAQLQLAKAHGLPAFKLAGASEFESALSQLVKSGGDLTSRALRQLMAHTATAGLSAVASRSLQDDFDAAVSCMRGLMEAYQDLCGLLGRVNMLVSGVSLGEEAQVLQEVSQLLQDHEHLAPFEEGSSTCTEPASSVLEVAQANIAALENSLQGWEGRVRRHHTPSRVLKWASSGGGRTPSGS